MDFAKDLFREVMEDDLMGGAAELAYRFLFALFPFVIFMAALSGYVSGWIGIENPTDRIITNIGDAIPADAAGVLETQLQGILDGSGAGLLSFGAVAALWASSSATKTVMKWMNRVYNVTEDRPSLRKQVVGLALTLLGAVAFIVGAAALIVGQVAGSEIAGGLGLGDTWATVVSWARIPIVLLLLMIAMAVVYWLTPNADLPFAWITPGAVLFVLIWIAATVAFGFYVANFANYQATYGALGGVIILMLWLYITAFVLLLGGKINAVTQARRMETTEKQTDRAAIEQRDLDPEIARERRIRPDQREQGAVSINRGVGEGEGEGRKPRRMERADSPSRGAMAGMGAVFGVLALRRILGRSGEDDGTSSAARPR